jgi:predicted Zn-dependent peptidase
MKFYQETLSNGLTVIGEQRESAVSTALGFFVKTGSRDETDDVSGVSHFLEHMMFKGTERRSALDITYELGEIGAQANAYTSEERTVYYMGVLPEYLESAFDLLSDMLRPSLSQEEFDVEKKVILEEIALYQDRPSFLIFESALRHFFDKHPAGNSVLGTIESITALKRDQMLSYFEQRYSPSNIVLAVSGNFDWPQIMSLAQKHCSHWVSHDASRVLNPHKASEKIIELKKAGISRSHLCLVAPGPAADDEARYSADVLACILGDSSGSKAYWSLVDKGIADSVSIGADAMDGAGMLYAYAGFDPTKFDTVVSTLRELISDPLSFDDSDLDRAKTKIRTRLVLQAESSMRRLMVVGSDWLSRAEYSPVENEQLHYKSIDRDSITAFSERFPMTPLTQVSLLPE